jgi:hypothetical protein
MRIFLMLAEQGPPYPTPWWVWLIIALVFIFFGLPPLVVTAGIFIQFFTDPESLRRSKPHNYDGRPPDNWGGGGY